MHARTTSLAVAAVETSEASGPVACELGGESGSRSVGASMTWIGNEGSWGMERDAQCALDSHISSRPCPCPYPLPFETNLVHVEPTMITPRL